MKPIATKTLLKLLRQSNCIAGDTEGSHQKWTAPRGRSTSVKIDVKEQAPGTLRNIQRHLEPELGPRWLEKELK